MISLHELKAGRETLEVLQAIVNNIGEFRVNLDKLTTNEALQNAKDELNHTITNLESTTNTNLSKLVATDTALDLRVTALENKPIPPTGVQKVILDSSSGNVADIVEVPVVNNEITLPNANFSVSLGAYNLENPNSGGRNLNLQKATYDENTKKIQFDNQFNIYAHQNIVKIDDIEISPKSITDTQILNLQTQINEINANTGSSETQINYIKSSPLVSGLKGLRSTTNPSDDPSILGSLDYGFIWFNILSKTYFIYKGIDTNTNKIIWEQVELNQKVFDEISITLGSSFSFCLGQARLVDINGNEYFEPSDSEATPFGTYPVKTNITAQRYFVIDGEKYEFSVSYVGTQPYRSNNVWCYLSPFNPNKAVSVCLSTTPSSAYTSFSGASFARWSECQIKFSSPLPSKIIGVRFSSMYGSSSAKSIFSQSDNFAEIRFKHNDLVLSGLGWENITALQATQDAVSEINNTSTAQNRLILGASVDYNDFSIYTDNSSAVSVISENRAYLVE